MNLEGIGCHIVGVGSGDVNSLYTSVDLPQQHLTVIRHQIRLTQLAQAGLVVMIPKPQVI